jgi:hypothetical protein
MMAHWEEGSPRVKCMNRVQDAVAEEWKDREKW